SLLGQPGLDLLVPQHFPCLAVHAKQVPAEVLLVAGVPWIQAIAGVAGHEHLIAPDNGTGGTRSGKVDLPDEVLLIAPPGGQVFLITDAGAAGPAEVWPVPSRGGHGEQGETKSDQRRRFRVHGSSPVRECSGAQSVPR